MRKLGNDIALYVASLAGDDEQARINLRANQVRDRYKRAIELVYRDTAPLFLAHTNNVYIMKKGGVRTLIVYVDQSIFAAELNAQRELIRLHLLELFGEDVQSFEIHVSRGKYKNNHPYVPDGPGDSGDSATGGASSHAPAVPLDDDERAYVCATGSAIDDARLRETFQKAMTADLEWKKGENQSRS